MFLLVEFALSLLSNLMFKKQALLSNQHTVIMDTGKCILHNALTENFIAKYHALLICISSKD